MSNSSNATGFVDLLNGGAGASQAALKEGIQLKAFILNIGVGLVLFTLEFSGFLLLKSSAIGRRIYQPKTYLVQHRLRVEVIPVNPIAWLKRIFRITDEELKAKCGLDGYFFIHLIRALLIVFVPLMLIVVTILIPINATGGTGNNVFTIEGNEQAFNVTGLDLLAWPNIAPTQTHRYWAHLVCAIGAIGWTLYRIYREKVNFITVRQQFLTSPEQRIKASARTVLVTNIPSEYRTKEALEGLYDVFVDNDDRRKLTIWINRDYSAVRQLVSSRSSLRHALEKEELKILRNYNKKVRQDHSPLKEADKQEQPASSEPSIPEAFEADCEDKTQPGRQDAKESQITLIKNGEKWAPASAVKFWIPGEKRKVPKIAWLRSEIARLTVEIEELLLNLDDDERFPRQNSAFIQFDRQMAANMACSLVSHHLYGRMAPRFLGVAPHEIVWPNMGVTSLARLVRSCIALVLFVVMLVLWGLPTAFLGILSQLESLRGSTSWLLWLRPWPSWVISLISGPLASILLALLIQLIVPALMRKLAVLFGAPTRSRRELLTQNFYFAFLFIELVLVTSISSGIITVVPQIVSNPVNIPKILATNLPKSANYFFNYLIIQTLGFSGSVLFQYLRILYITTIWPWFTQTPRQEAWLQTTIPHQMWANVYSLTTNFAVIGLIFSVIAPLMLVFVSSTFSVLWIAYRHNYYYVQRNKVDTHGLLFNNAISHLFAGVYVLEIALIGLFFLARDIDGNLACTTHMIIMIVVVCLTAAFHFVLEDYMRPLYEFLPVTLEDPAVHAEKERFNDSNRASEDNLGVNGEKGNDDDPISPRSTKSNNDREPFSPRRRTTKSREPMSPATKRNRYSGVQQKSESATAANARNTLARLRKQTAARVLHLQAHRPEAGSGTEGSADPTHRRELAEQLGAALESYPDELADLTPQERDDELKAAFQDPVTREPPPVIWLPQDAGGLSDESVRWVQRNYGTQLQYSNAGAYLTSRNKCEVVQPAPDVRPDWLLDWVL